MKKLTVFLLIALLVAVATALPAFALEGEYDLEYYTKYKDKGYTLSVFNWGEYISDGSDDSLDVNAAFEELTGIKVVYSNFDTNETLYAKLKIGGTSYDVVIPSDYMVSRLIDEGLVRPLNYDNIPNFKYISRQYVNPEYDPENLYSVPYTWGIVGLIFNKTMIDEDEAINSWGELWNPLYQDNILMFGNSKDAFGIAFKMLGYPINAESFEQIDKATELLKQQKDLLQAYVMDEIFDKMTGEEAAIAPYYAGDFITMREDNEDLSFVYPAEGTNIFVDAMCIPTSSKNPELAEMYINFMLEPEVGLANIEYIGYSTPNDAVYELLDEETKNDPIRYPDESVISRAEYFVNTSAELSAYMDEKWTEILTADERYSRMLMPMVLAGCLLAIILLNVFRTLRKHRDLRS